MRSRTVHRTSDRLLSPQELFFQRVAVTRHPRLGVIGARLCLSGPGLASIGMGLSLIGLPWPDALLAVLPVSFGALLLWLFRGRITSPYG